MTVVIYINAFGVRFETNREPRSAAECDGVSYNGSTAGSGSVCVGSTPATPAIQIDMARSSSGLGHRPLKAKIESSNLLRATKCSQAGIAGLFSVCAFSRISIIFCMIVAHDAWTESGKGKHMPKARKMLALAIAVLGAISLMLLAGCGSSEEDVKKRDRRRSDRPVRDDQELRYGIDRGAYRRR